MCHTSTYDTFIQGCNSIRICDICTLTGNCSRQTHFSTHKIRNKSMANKLRSYHLVVVVDVDVVDVDVVVCFCCCCFFLFFFFFFFLFMVAYFT